MKNVSRLSLILLSSGCASVPLPQSPSIELCTIHSKQKTAICYRDGKRLKDRDIKELMNWVAMDSTDYVRLKSCYPDATEGVTEVIK
jgi:predicted Fe-S protein YdhL (DUF1289 family)